jgi:hypothetical protein
VRTLVAVVFVISAAMASGQSPAGGGPQSPGNGVGAQSYSVEGDLLSDEANQSNADAIVCDISPGVFSNGNGNTPPKCDFKSKDLSKASVMLLSSTDPTLTYFQLWRSAMFTTDTLQQQATAAEAQAEIVVPPGCGGCKSLTGVETAISSTLTILQTIAGFFATNQSITGIQGTPQDQPLVAAVGRRLLSMKANVYTPSIYSPYSLTGLDYTQSPFLANLAALETTENKLSAELFNTNLKLNQANQTLSSKQAQLTALQAKAGKAPTPDQKDEISKLTADNQGLQSTISQLTQSVSSLTTMIQNIQSFINSLISTSAAPANSGNPSPGGNNTNGQGQQTTPGMGGSGPSQNPANPSGGSPTGGGPSGNNTAQSTSAPPLVSILYADGVARVLGATVKNALGTSSSWQPDASWRVLSVKAMEAGSDVSSKTRMFYLGNDIIFSGGAVATYSLFKLDGSLQCAGNVFDYGGFVKSGEFSKNHSTQGTMVYNLHPEKQVLFQNFGSSCVNPLP